MKSNIRRGWPAALAIAVFAGFAMPVEAGYHEDPEVVIEWNQLLQSNIPSTVSLFSFRYYAMMHIAMFDAVNSIEGGYTRYRVRVHAQHSASAEAAAAQAAHDVLVALIPGAQPAFDAALAARLATIPSWRAAQGASVGRRVARAIIEWRTADGFELPNLPYAPPAIPGLWQPTAPGQAAAGVQFGLTKPFGLLTATQYLPAPPPLLNSARYAEDFENVKAIGALGSTTRTTDQTLQARLFAGPPNYSPNPFALWSHVARNVARSEGLTLIATARLFALVSAAMNDGLQTSHASKFVYGLWRPVTAIRRADEDFNDLTTPDATWTALLGTPPYPSHSSNLTCIGASAARALERVLDTDSVPFSVTWTGLNGNQDVTRSYGAFSELAQEGGLSRVYGGIHFLFEIDESHVSCTKVADFIHDNYMRARH